MMIVASTQTGSDELEVVFRGLRMLTVGKESSNYLNIVYYLEIIYLSQNYYIFIVGKFWKY